MHARAARLVADLNLAPHPEGGYFREIHRAESWVQPEDGRPRRSALTTIYFLLPGGEVSRWHRVGSDEVWHYLEGDPIELLQADGDFTEVTSERLGTYGEQVEPVRVVAAGRWQAARSLGEYTLVSCTVGPGFDFADFVLLRDHLQDPAVLDSRDPRLAAFL